MKILIVAATSFELKAVEESLSGIQGDCSLHYFNAGIGMVSTAYRLTRHLCNNSYDLAINVGIAGSFKKDYPIGSVLEVNSDRFSELGAEDGEDFRLFSEMDLQDENEFPFEGNLVRGDASVPTGLPKVSGITVNKVHGNEASISKIVQLFHPDVESMEGAAFMYVCKMEKVQCLQIRAISNFVERRDSSKWKIKEPLHNLGLELCKYIRSL